ncbi:MAG: hypothetical protein AB8B77_06905 [Alphaproteobacteria bacterium]
MGNQENVGIWEKIKYALSSSMPAGNLLHGTKEVSKEEMESVKQLIKAHRQRMNDKKEKVD